jgi:PAS domain S-box-containing protein
LIATAGLWGQLMNMESGTEKATKTSPDPLLGGAPVSGAPAVSSSSASGSFAKIASVLNTKITAPDAQSLAKIATVLNTKITLPTLPKRLVADIHLHERLAKQKEALTFLSNHEAITHGNVKLAAELITETLARVIENEYTGVWLLNESGDCLNVIDEFVSSRHTHEPEDEYARHEYPGWFESMMNRSHIVANSEMDIFTLKPEFFEENQSWGIKSGLETTIYAYGEASKVIGLLQSDDNVERTFFEDEIEFQRQVANLFAAVVHNEQFHLLEIKIHKKEKNIQEQREVLRDIMSLKALNDGDTKSTFDFICKKLTALYGVDGCTIWQIFGSTEKLTCVSCYDKKQGNLKELGEFHIDRHDTPIYFDVIASGRCFAVEDVSKDRHLSELYDDQIEPFGTVSVLDAGVFHYKKLMGSICLDASVKRTWDNGDKLFLTEITELICECILNKENKHLASQLRILSKAIEHSPCAIFAVDANQQIQYCNSHFEKWVGLDKSALIGSNMSQLKVAEISAVEFGRLLTSVRQSKLWQGGLKLISSNGQSRKMAVTATPIYDDNSAVSEFIFFCE